MFLKGSLFVLVESIYKSRKFKKGLERKVKLLLYRMFRKAVEMCICMGHVMLGQYQV